MNKVRFMFFQVVCWIVVLFPAAIFVWSVVTFHNFWKIDQINNYPILKPQYENVIEAKNISILQEI